MKTTRRKLSNIQMRWKRYNGSRISADSRYAETRYDFVHGAVAVAAKVNAYLFHLSQD